MSNHSSNYPFAFLFSALLLFVSCHTSPTRKSNQTGSFRAASYNIRIDAKADIESGNGWNIRKYPLAELIARHKFDIVGTQEGTTKQLEELKQLLPAFDFVAHPYGGPQGTSHNCATYYNSEKFKVIETGVFWFSETPDTPSIGWDASDQRICQWIKFADNETKKQFYFFNGHFYWRNHVAKENSGPLLVRKIDDIAGQNPVIAVGDYNSEPHTKQVLAIKERLSDTYDVTISERMGPEGTSFSGGVFEGEPKWRIDYIFISRHFTAKDYLVLDDKYNNKKYPSDHLPVTSLLLWNK